MGSGTTLFCLTLHNISPLLPLPFCILGLFLSVVVAVANQRLCIPPETDLTLGIIICPGSSDLPEFRTPDLGVLRRHCRSVLFGSIGIIIPHGQSPAAATLDYDISHRVKGRRILFLFVSPSALLGLLFSFFPTIADFLTRSYRWRRRL